MTRPIFPALRKVEVSLASHAGVFRGARFWDEKRAPLKTPAWEAKVSLKQSNMYKKNLNKGLANHIPIVTLSEQYLVCGSLRVIFSSYEK